MRRHSHRGNRHDFSRGFEGTFTIFNSFFCNVIWHTIWFPAEVSAEELFNMFFGGSFGGPNVYVRRGRQWERQRAENANQVCWALLIFTHYTKLISFIFVAGICWKWTIVAAHAYFNSSLLICNEQFSRLRSNLCVPKIKVSVESII